LLLGSDCIAHFHHQFLGRTGSTRRSINHLAKSRKEIILLYVLLMMFVMALLPMFF
jgi:hypothetical protein